MSAHESRAERAITPTQSQTNRIAGLGILLPPRSIAPRRRSIIPGAGGVGSVADRRRLAHASRPPFAVGECGGEAPEEFGLDDDCLLELVDQHALVRPVDVGVPVGRSEQEELGLGHRLLQRVDERDRATGCSVRRLDTPRRSHRILCRLVCRSRRVREEPVAGCAGLNRQADPERLARSRGEQRPLPAPRRHPGPGGRAC